MPQSTYTRRLPHIHSVRETIFVTFRTADSLPKEVIQQWQDEQEAELRQLQQRSFGSLEEQREYRYNLQKRSFARFDSYLDKAAPTAHRLDQPAIAAPITEALHWHQEQQNYDLLCFCIMPNHVHFVATLLKDSVPFQKVIKSIKAFTAKKINSHLNRIGPFWQREYYDHVVRNGEELKRIIAYVLENPLKAGLCKDWEDWPYTYQAEDV